MRCAENYAKIRKDEIKMKQKKTISIMLALIMTISLFSAFSVFSEGDTTITISSINDTAGSVVDVDVKIENNPGILGATLTFEFDEDLTLIGATNGSAFSALTMTRPGTLESPCNFVWDGQDLSDSDIRDGVILTLQFKIPDDAQSGTKYNITAYYDDGAIVNNYLNSVSPSIVNGSIEVLDFIYGDLNEDKKVNISDVILMRRHIAGRYDQIINETAADVNVDTKINTTDTILVRRYIAGGYGITLPYTITGCNHVMEETPAKEATQEAPGNIAYWYCKACGKYFSDAQGTTEITLEETILPALPKDEYTIQYVCDMISPYDTTFKYTDTYKPTQTKVLQTPKMDTYKFLGWSDKEGHMYGTEIPEGTTGDLVLYANWASNRNKAVPVTSLGDPIICEDSDNGQILFVYEIGKIENIPLFETQDLLVVDGMVTSTGIVKQRSIAKGNAEEVGKTIANATTNSSTWTLSKEWNETTTISEEWAEQQGMTVEEAEEFCKSNSNTYNLTNSSGGSSSLVNSDSSSYRISANQAHQDSTSVENQKYTGFHVDGKISNSTTVSAGITVPLKVASAEAGISNTTAFEIGAGYDENNYTKNVSTGTDSWENNIDLSSSKSSTATSEKTWNSSEGFSSSSSTSSSSSVSKAVSELISQKYSHDTSYSTGGSQGESQEFASSNAQEDLYSSSVTYSEEEIEISERTFESIGNTYGAYRLVQVGMARVFGVVGYDIKNKAYYTYTYSVLDDDEYKEYLDYSFDRTFNDYETSVLPFEIPGFVNDYVNSRIASSKLQIDDNGIVTKYLGDTDDEVVLIPSYYTKTNTTTNQPEVIKIKGIVPELFKDNTNIIGVSLGNFINEIPESAFEGCVNLKEIVCPNVIRVGDNAFKGCSSLSEFSLPDEIEFVGDNAFDGVPAIKSNAPTKEIASIVASSNAQNITLDISKIEADDFSDMPLEVSAIAAFKLFGGVKEYKGLNIKSNAQNTIISGVAISECNTVPIEVSSPNVTLERVTAYGDGFALILKADETKLSLEGVSNMLSESENSIIGKNITLEQVNDETYSAIESDGNVLVCGSVTNNDGYIPEEKIIIITEEEYVNYLTSRKVTFDANGGTVAVQSKMAALNMPMGELPLPSRDYYTFDGWYTEAEGGELVTEETLMTASNDITLYAHWGQNGASAWTLAEEVPADAQVVDQKWSYTLTEYTTSSSSSLSGWTQYDSTWEWGPYGAWSGWSPYWVAGSDTRKVESRHTYRYYYFYCPSCQTRSANWDKYCWCGTYVPVSTWTEIWVETSYDYLASLGGRWSYGNKYYTTWIDGYNTYWEKEQTNHRDEYRYADRSKIYTYYYKRDLDKESTTYPTGSNISNVQEWVQYREK